MNPVSACCYLNIMLKKKNTYTTGDAAKALGITKQAVSSAIKSGALKARRGKIVKTIVQVTRGWVIDHDAIKNYRVSLSHQKRGRKSVS